MRPAPVDFSVNGLALSGDAYYTKHAAGEPTLGPLCFPDSVADSIITNGVPVDQGATWLGPSVSSIEIKRVLKSGGTWYNDGVLVYRKP